jgi:hypothetical protein
MSEQLIVVQGMVLPDGRLEIADKVPLPPGPVEVTIKAIPTSSGETVWTVLERIWAGQRARGFVPRGREDIDAELQAMRDEWDEPSSGETPPPPMSQQEPPA